MNLYGIGYMGSKTAIAEDIIDLLPRGRRFVDLFGGGFAMSHCALLSGKYEEVYYNELNPLLVELIKKAINGDYNYNKFKPEFITREKFRELKDKDGYVKYCWSFGSAGQHYMFNPETEKVKKMLHNAVVFNEIDPKIYEIYPEFCVRGDNISERRQSVTRIMRQAKQRCDLEQLERLERLQQLERLELHCGSYLDYEYKSGDVVYCDPPYEGVGQYEKGGFNHQEFYNWVASRDYPVFFSSYDISDKRFEIIWEKTKITTMSQTLKNIKKLGGAAGYSKAYDIQRY